MILYRDYSFPAFKITPFITLSSLSIIIIILDRRLASLIK